MAWLVTHMWMALTAAAVFALILGWTLRGVMVTGRMRKAIVEKDIALTELEQARDEIERLFAAQRAQKGEGAGVADSSARKIAQLTAELEKSKNELAVLKARGPVTEIGTPGDNAPVIVRAQRAPDASPGLQDGEEDADSPSLVWRNRHLESRVRHLEAQLAESAAAAPAVATGLASSDIRSADEEGIAKLKWQADYLKQRVEALEAELAKAPVEPEAAPAPAEDSSEELARLRWRNRFLEGRLAYFEGGAGEAAEAAQEPTGAEAVLSELQAADAAADVAEAVEAMVEEVSAVETGERVADFGEDRAGADAIEEASDADAFEDVSDDEEESLAEADHAGRDVLSDEEYDEEYDTEEHDAETAEDSEDVEEADEDEFADVSDDEEESLEEADEAELEDGDDENAEYADDAEDEDSDDEEADDEDASEEDEEAGEFEDDVDEDDVDEDDADEDESDEDEDGSDEDDQDDDEDESDEDGSEYEDEASDEEDEDVEYESEEEIVAERPLAMEGPVDGHPDDLTMIGGIGPKIQVLLNELGIWHYDQIAAWTPENVAWIDQHLNFNGRIGREGWVEQAAVLVGDAENV